MTEVISTIVLSILGVGGIFWAFLAASRKRPQILLDVKGYGSRDSESDPKSHDVFFHVVFKNKSVEKNAVDKLIFIIWNKRRSEYVWESWAVKLYKPDIKTNWIGEEIETPVVLDGKHGVEAIDVVSLPDEVFFNYLADRIPHTLRSAVSFEKPFHIQLLARDSNENHFTGELTKTGVQLIDYESLRHMHVKNTDITNACMYGRPRIKHILGFYLGRVKRWIRFKVRMLFYLLGIISSV